MGPIGPICQLIPKAPLPFKEAVLCRYRCMMQLMSDIARTCYLLTLSLCYHLACLLASFFVLLLLLLFMGFVCLLGVSLCQISVASERLVAVLVCPVHGGCLFAVVWIACWTLFVAVFCFV